MKYLCLIIALVLWAVFSIIFLALIFPALLLAEESEWFKIPEIIINKLIEDN